MKEIMNYQRPRAEKLSQNDIHHKFTELLQLEESEIYRLVVENTNEGVVVAQGDQLCYINNRAIEISGYSQEELLSRNFIELVYPDDRESIAMIYIKKLRGEKVPDTISFRILTKDGQIRWLLGASVKISWQGRPALIGFATDITSQKHSEEALRESDETLRVLLYSIQDLVLLVDLDGTVLTVNSNAAERFGRNPEELKGMNIYALMPTEVVELRKKKAQEVICTKLPVRYTEEIAGKFFGCNLFPILDDNGNVKCFTVFVIDITEHYQSRKASQKVREELEYRVKERTQELEAKAKNLEEVNTALKVLLKRLDEDKQVLEEKVLFNMRQLVEPNVEKLKKSRLTARQKNILDIIESNLKNIVSPFARGLSTQFLKFTPTEIEVADLIRQGKTTKEIANLLNLSGKTIEFHRDNIRRKIGIKNKKINLRTHLLSIR